MKTIRKMLELSSMKALLFITFFGISGAIHAGDVYWNPLEGNDGYLGTSAISPVRTFERAKYLVSQQPEGSYIVLVRYYFLHDGEVVTLDGKISETRNVLLKQHGEAVSGHSPYNTMGVDGYNFVLRHSGTKLTLKNITIEGTYTGTGINPYTGPTYPADNCPLILLEENTQLEMGEGAILKNCRRTEFSDPDAHGYGAAVYMYAGASFTMNGGVIEDCFTDDRGGAIYMRHGTTFTMNGGTIRNCGTGNFGGAICASEAATVNLYGGVITDCYAKIGTTGGRGGAICMNGGTGSTIVMNGGEIKNCSSLHDGSAISVYGGTGTNTITLTKGNIHDCVCRPTEDDDNTGGWGTVHVGNTNTWVYINGDEMYIHDNFCRKYGGAVDVTGGAHLSFSKGKVYRNKTGIYRNDQGVITGAGAFHITGGSTYEMTGGELYENWTSGVGGALHSSYEGEMLISGGDIYDNVADAYGGAFNLNTQGTLTFPVGSTAKVHGNISCNGGAVLLDGSNLNIYDGEIYDNHATDTCLQTNFEPGIGGAFCMIMEGVDLSGVTVPADIKIYGGSIHDNTATKDGGAVYMAKNSLYPLSGESEIIIQGGEIYNNKALTGNGGAIYSDVGSIFRMGKNTNDEVGHFINNQAGNNGGGVYLVNADFKITAGTFENNKASKVGGGFYISGDESVVIIEGGEIKDNTADSLGGGFAVIGGDVTIRRADAAYPTSISNNSAPSGGGMYVSDGSVTVSDATISSNVSTAGNGGAFDIDNGGLTVSHSSITGNKALNGNGGGAYVGNGNIEFNAGTSVTDNTAIDGGGIYVDGGNLTYTDAVMSDNTATNNGGGFYTTGGDVQINGSSAEISSNTATKSGGGLYIGGDIALDGGTIKLNAAGIRGGGVYVAEGGRFDMTGGTIGGTTAQGNYTTGNTSYGGGLYMGGGTATITGGSISGNHTDSDGMGGAIYMNGGTCTLSNGAVIGGVPSGTQTYANTAKYGGGIYSANGTITVKGGAIGHNSAVKGGGIYTNGNQAKVYVQKDSSKADDPSYIEYNTAQYGGGIYGEKGLVEFSDGFIRYNTASEAGGGIYVDANDTLYLKGSANMLLNGVPTGHKGGGVYLVGSLIVGEQTSTLGTILAQDNYAYTTTQPDTLLNGGHVVDSLRNNVYLPNPVVHEYGESTHAGVIEVVENGISNESHVGFSVPHGNVPVIYCIRSSTSWDYLHHFSTGQSLQYNLFDDSGRYKSVQYSNDPAFNPDHVYLYGFWSDEVTGEGDEYCQVDMADFEGRDTIYISNPCQLAFFISWVNGRETPTHLDPHPTVKAKLMDDIDMSEFGWVPIGTGDNAYSGVFDGDGHTVSGIRSLLNDYHLNYGFFGNLADGAVVKNLFVKGANFHIESKEHYTGPMYIGGVAGLTSGNATIENCESESVIVVEPDNTNTIMGGLVGRTAAGDKIKSSIGIADMTGFLMGGLAGQNNGSILNSFSNAKFTKAVSGRTEYMGGLVGANEGHVENCYSRVCVPVPATNYFGYLAGDNDGGTLKYSYARQNVYVSTEGTAGTQTGIGTYGDTQLPYLYGHRDTQVDANNDYVPTGTDADKQLMIVLNRWVDTINSKQSAINYTKWGRPWQESDAQKPLNDDYPILKMPMAEAVAAKAGDPYLYYNPVDGLLVRYTDAESAIWLYRNPSDTVRGDNSTSAAKLYIAEDVVLLNANPLYAYVGITLDNSAGANGGGANPTYGSYVGIETDETDWHMISTSLSDAPIGINYSDNGSYDFSWGHPEGMPYYLFYQKGNAKHGYFPSHRFGESYPSTDARIEAGSYYNEWDFYAYSEPNYHWINFKRNNTSHHHFDTEGHEAIEYHNGDPLLADDLGNESRLVPGKGYFAATREETFLQCQGHLNADEVTIGLTHTPNIPRHGYNLIGNPYQAYLDFDAFADANWGDDGENIWGEGETPSYTILDEDELDSTDSVETVMGRKPVFYKTFSYRCSSNPDVSAGRFIHPHQGFFVRLGEDKTGATASFEPAQRNATDTVTSKFRGNDHIDYPLVNLFAIEENGAADVVTVELGRPDQGGAALMESLRVGNGKIWCHYNDKDYAIAYTQPGISEVAIRFESVKDTEYTMRWSTRNGDFSYLHLIDNVTGADVDCLTTDEYKFSASTSDYKSRFRLVFGYTGIEEPEEVETSQNFAFVMGDELVVTGEGVLQVFDMTGRMVASQELHGVQTTVSLPNAANGVYVLRLTEGKQSRIQKMVISK